MLLAMESYEAALTELLELRALSALGADRAVRALLMPAFDDEVAITAWTRRGGAWLDVRALPVAARPFVMERAGVRMRSQVLYTFRSAKRQEVAPEPIAAADPPDLRPQSIELPIRPGESDALWKRLDAVDREPLRAQRDYGLDGISIKTTFVDADGSMESFELWSPARRSAGGELVAALLDFACPRIPDPRLAAAVLRVGSRLR